MIGSSTSKLSNHTFLMLGVSVSSFSIIKGKKPVSRVKWRDLWEMKEICTELCVEVYSKNPVIPAEAERDTPGISGILLPALTG